MLWDENRPLAGATLGVVSSRSAVQHMRLTQLLPVPRVTLLLSAITPTSCFLNDPVE